MKLESDPITDTAYFEISATEVEVSKEIGKECGHQVVSRLPRLLTKASSQRDVVAIIGSQDIVFGEIDR